MASLRVSLAENGPYLVEGDFQLRDALRKRLDTGGAVELCRCGESKSKPFCDNIGCETGLEAGDEGGPSQPRVYADDSISVSWHGAICIHDGACVFGAGDVFDPRRRPWVDLSNVDPERIAGVIRGCPSGTLHYRRLGGGDDEQPERPATIVATRNGPYFLRGDIEIVAASGEHLHACLRAALCRCGASRNKPFCDNNHAMINFEAP